ncbi:MAG: WecB/TagA/CpsF family glycosyltransferase [Melioribacteraceae bacterium]
MSINKINVFAIQISKISTYELVYKKIIHSYSKPNYITVNNVHTIIQATRQNYYKKIINNSFLSLPDGQPLSFYAKLKGEKNINRIFGPTFMEKTIDWGQKVGLKHFFFGSNEIVLRDLKQQINKKYPRTIITGSFSPPYKLKFTEEENLQFIEMMNKSGADLFWIGLGAPKQEIWMYENYKKLNHGIMIGIGAGFDYLAGNTKHAPEWMKNMALEWLYRLIQEPRRLWKRYLITNSLFLYYVFLEMTGLRKFDK